MRVLVNLYGIDALMLGKMHLVCGGSLTGIVGCECIV